MPPTRLPPTPPRGRGACPPTRAGGPRRRPAARDGGAEPPAGLFGQITATIDRKGATPTVRDGRRRQIKARRTVWAGAVALLAAAAVVIGIVVTRGPATTDVVLAGT